MCQQIWCEVDERRCKRQCDTASPIQTLELAAAQVVVQHEAERGGHRTQLRARPALGSAQKIQTGPRIPAVRIQLCKAGAGPTSGPT